MGLLLILLISNPFVFGALVAGVNVYGGDHTGPTPRFLSRGTTYQTTVGDSVNLPCDIQNLGTYVLIWRKGPTILSAKDLMVTRDNRFSLIGQSLQITNVRPDDQGDYTCQIGDGSQGDLIHTLEILLPPTVQMSPSIGQITARKGGSVTFECKSSGNPPPEIHWSRKDGTNMPSGLPSEPGYVLTLNDVQRSYAGTYQCTASNGIGHPVSAEMHLHVLYPPEVSVLRSWVNSGEGLESKLDCIVHADPPPEVLWYQDSFLLQPTDRRIMSNNGKTHSLIIKNLQYSDFGNYSCVVSNSIGRDKKFIELSGKPGPATVISPGYSNPHSYNLTWTVQSVFPIKEVRILYRRLVMNSTYQHTGQWHDKIVYPFQIRFDPSTSERTQWHRLTDLHGDSVYECLVAAKNQHGYGEFSDLHQWFTSMRGRIMGPGVAFSHKSKLESQIPVLVLSVVLAAILRI